MDAKEVKAALKAAREAIRNKEYKEALKHCKGILKHDKSNYNAWVFVGRAAEGLEQMDQALMAYKRATEAEPQQLLAWQGLCGFYEKSGKAEDKAELVGVYEKLLELNKSNADKKYEIGMKLADLHQNLKDVDKAVTCLKSLIEQANGEPKQLMNLWQKLADLLQQEKNLPAELKTLLLEAYEVMVHSVEEGSEELVTTWRKYIQHLLQNRADQAKIVQESTRMTQLYPNEAYPHQCLCQVYLDRSVAGHGPDRATIDDSVSSLRKLDEDSAILKLLQGLWSLQQGDAMAALKLVTAGMKVLGSCISGWVIEARCEKALHDKHSMLKSVKQGHKALKKKDSVFSGDVAEAEGMLDLLQVQAWLDMADTLSLQQALDTCTKVLEKRSDIVEWLVCLAYTRLKLNDTEGATKAWQKATDVKQTEVTMELEGWVHFEQGQLDESQKSFEGAIAVNEKHAASHYGLGRVYWERRNDGKEAKEQCFKSLLQAAKLDPYHSKTFLYLGYYYKDVLQDVIRARKCFQKAYDLDPDSKDGGAALVDSLMSLGEEESAVQVLRRVTQTTTAISCKWAWLRLGLYQLKYDDPTVAISSFQSALRADSADQHCWECLGEAYMNRGSYSAALKAFSRAVELDPESMYCLYQIAAIKQTLQMYSEAAEDYRVVLDKSATYVPALKGLGETRLLLARGALSHFFHGRAVDHCQAAIEHLTKAAGIRSDMSCLWKLLGDSCTLLHPVPAEDFSVSVPAKLMQEEAKADQQVNLNKRELLALGGRCYGMALKLLPECAAVWHDLGINYYHQAQQTEGTAANQLTAKALQVLQKAVTLSPANHNHWNGLGVVAAHPGVNKLALAQHCFIKSIQAEANNAIAWTNLGTLYYNNGDIKLSHEAFKMAQSLDPSYVACWIGQALIAETVGDQDTMDLFRHTTELGNHIEGALGYAQWVCNALKDKSKIGMDFYRYAIEQMAAMPAASDALAKYTDRVRTNPQAYNMYGLLLEKQGLNRMACEAFSRAVTLLEQSVDSDHLPHSRANYARLLCKTAQYEAALDQFKALKELTFQDLCGLGLAHYKAGQLQESYEAYERALESAKTEEHKSQVYTALAMVTYKVQDVEGAKSALFKSSQTGSPSADGLKALCSLGLLQSDMTLATAVLQELIKLGAEDSLAADTSYLGACVALLQGDVLGGCRLLTKAIHMHPANTRAWSNLASYLQQTQLSGLSTAATCARKALLLSTRPHQTIPTLVSLTSLGAGQHGTLDPMKDALKAAQKAIHIHPGEHSNWFSLLVAIYAKEVLERDKKRPREDLQNASMTVAAHLLAKVETELSLELNVAKKRRLQELHLWCVQQYVLALLTAGRLDQAQQFMAQAVWLYDSDATLRGLSAAVEGNLKELRAAANLDSSSPFVWLLLASLYLSRGSYNGVESSYKGCVESSQNSATKLMALTHLTHTAFKQVMKTDCDLWWSTLFTDGVTEALKIDPHCSIVHLMQGLFQMNEDNHKQAKRSFQIVLSHTSADGGRALERNIARQQLMIIYQAKQDQDSIQALLEEAKREGDTKLLQSYKPAGPTSAFDDS